MAKTPVESRSKRAPAKAKKPRAAARTARKSAAQKPAKLAEKPAAKSRAKAPPQKAAKPAAKRASKARVKPKAPARQPATPRAGAVRKALTTREEESPSLAQYVREDHKLRESLVDQETASPWWDGALRSALSMASAGVRMVRRFVPGLAESDSDSKERDTLVPA